MQAVLRLLMLQFNVDRVSDWAGLEFIFFVVSNHCHGDVRRALLQLLRSVIGIHVNAGRLLLGYGLGGCAWLTPLLG